MKLNQEIKFNFIKIKLHFKSAFNFCSEKARPWFDSDKNLFLLIFLVILIFFLNRQWSNLDFFVRANLITFLLASPFLFLFIWLYKRNSFGTRESFWTVISILTAIIFFLFQNANEASTKGFAIYAAHQYNCNVADNIIALDQKENKSENFTLNYFVTEPYLTNVNLLFGNYNEKLGKWLLFTVYKMQGANSLLMAVQSLNIQGVNLLTPSSGYFVNMYNKQVIEIAKEIKANLPCGVPATTPSLFDVIKNYLMGFWNKIVSKVQTWLPTP